MKKELRFLLLTLEGVITVALSVLFFYTASAAKESAMLSNALPILLPALIHLWITFIVAIVFNLFYRINIGAESALLPLIFTTVSLSAIKMVPLYQSFAQTQLASPYVIGVTYHFSLLYTAFLFISASLFKQSIQPKRLAQYSLIGFSFSLFISLMTPININDPSFFYQVCVSDRLFLIVCIALNTLAVISFLVPLFEQQSYNRQSVGRPLAYSLMVVGNAMVTIPCALVAKSFGLLFYIIGILLLLFLSRTHRVWT